MGRLAGIDYGQTRIGLALSDPMRMIASPYKTIQAQKALEQTAHLIAQELKDYELDAIVIGLPLHLSGKESEGSETVRKLAPLIEIASKTPVILWDERLTTAQVERTLKEAEMKRKKRTQYVDAMAASVILQSYLDSPCNK